MLIYECQNKFTGEKYIGLTTKTLEKRKRSHLRSVRKGSQLKFHQAIRKYGKEAFKWKTVEKCNSIDELTEREKYWIKTLDTKNKGYNSTDGGEVGSHDPKKRKRRRYSKSNPIAFLSAEEYTLACLSHRLDEQEKNIEENKINE